MDRYEIEDYLVNARNVCCAWGVAVVLLSVVFSALSMS